jgi:chorismate mutase/prephenate dehydrogenase
VSDSADDLEALRERIRRLDESLLEAVAERLALGRRAGDLKRRQGSPIVDYAQEKAVLDRARALASARGLDPRLAEDLFQRLIRASLTAQDEDSVRHAGIGQGRSAVIAGGAGRMGRWMDRFLQAQGFTTRVSDPTASPEDNDAAQALLPRADLVVCAAPPAAIARLYDAWAASPPRGVVVDIASIKTPLLEPIAALQAAGGRVASMHPMFGPATVLLRDCDILLCDTGDAAALRDVERLFEPTMARLVRLPLAEHDRVMADLLSLAHAAAIAFALALPSSAHPVGSTTFQALEGLAAAVVRESPEVYYEIQAKNPHSAAAVLRLAEALDRLMGAAAGGPEGFRALFEEARRRTPGRSENDPDRNSG